MFTKLNIKQEIDSPFKTPIKEEPKSNSDLQRKSVKRTVFERDSPYKKPEIKAEEPVKRISVKDRLGPKIDESSAPKRYIYLLYLIAMRYIS